MAAGNLGEYNSRLDIGKTDAILVTAGIVLAILGGIASLILDNGIPKGVKKRAKKI